MMEQGATRERLASAVPTAKAAKYWWHSTRMHCICIHRPRNQCVNNLIERLVPIRSKKREHPWNFVFDGKFDGQDIPQNVWHWIIFTGGQNSLQVVKILTPNLVIAKVFNLAMKKI